VCAPEINAQTKMTRDPQQKFFIECKAVETGTPLKILTRWCSLLVIVLLLSASVSAADTTELVRDNNKPTAYVIFSGGMGYAVSFSPPNASWPIRRVRVFGFIFGRPAEVGQDVTIEIWTMNGTVLHSSIHSYKKFKGLADWIDFNVDGPMVRENFRVVVYAPGIANIGGIQIAYDSSLSTSYSDAIVGKRILTDWKEVAFSQPTLSARPRLNWMIRVCSTPAAEVQTTTTSAMTTTSQSSIPFLGSFDMSRLQQIGGVAATGGGAFLGWFFKTRKRRLISGYLNKIESTVKDQSVSLEERRNRLSRIREEVLDLLKKGKIEEGQYSMLDTKLKDHIKELA